MTTTDLDAIRAAILASPTTDRVNWLVYADALEDAGDPRAELVRLMARHDELGRDELKRLALLRGTVSLLSDFGRARVEAAMRTWKLTREEGDVAWIEDVLRQECHPLLMAWPNSHGADGRPYLSDYQARRLIVKRNEGGGSRWVFSGNGGQGGSGGYADRAEAILAGLSAMQPESRERIRWIDLRDDSD